MPTDPPTTHVAWVKHLRARVPGDRLRVHAHHDEDERTSIDVFTSENADGVVAATVGLMDHTRPIATEVLVDARGPRCDAANLAATIAFFVMKDGWRVAPGVTFADLVGWYAPDLRVKHVLFVTPFQLPDGSLTRVDLAGGTTVHPLLAVPITEEERAFVILRGADALEDRWEQSSTDVLDWTRAGVV